MYPIPIENHLGQHLASHLMVAGALHNQTTWKDEGGNFWQTNRTLQVLWCGSNSHTILGITLANREGHSTRVDLSLLGLI